jgi:hypothetical protein
MHAVLVLAAFLVAAWHLTPMLCVLAMDTVPMANRIAACRSFALAAAKSMLILPAVILAPVVVPIALVFTPREANALPAWARPWDNDVSINGDQDEGAETYYAPGHDRRSFHARFVWLALRNRASWLAQRLGYEYQDGDQQDREHWGNVQTSRALEGHVLSRCAGVYQLYMVERYGSLCFRMNYGHKVWSEWDGRPRAMPIAITASFLSWEGA